MTTPGNRLFASTRLLIMVVIVLLAQTVWQEQRARGLKRDLARAREQFDASVSQEALERLNGRRADIVSTLAWLDEFYRSDAGLRRANGLWLADRKQPDFEAVGAWVFDVYLRARVGGATEEAARKSLEEAIRGTDEWRRVHAEK